MNVRMLHTHMFHHLIKQQRAWPTLLFKIINLHDHFESSQKFFYLDNHPECEVTPLEQSRNRQVESELYKQTFNIQ